MTNQPNKDKHDADRWEAFLDTVFAKSKEIQEIRMSVDTVGVLFNYMVGAGYTGLASGLMELGYGQQHLWDVPVVIDNTLTSPRLIIKLERNPAPQPKPKKEKPVDTWIDDEV